MEIIATPAWAKKLVPRQEGETNEAYRARWKAVEAEREQAKAEAEAARADALRADAGVYRVIVSGPGEAFQVCATSAPNAGEFFKRRLPLLLEQELAQGTEVILPATRTNANSRPLIVLEVDANVLSFRRGDRFDSVTHMGRELKVGNAGALIYQQKNAGKKKFRIRGVTVCFFSDYNPETGDVQ